jgi:hypothetical protein
MNRREFIHVDESAGWLGARKKASRARKWSHLQCSVRLQKCVFKQARYLGKVERFKEMMLYRCEL